MERFLRDPYALSMPCVESPFFGSILASMDIDDEKRQLAQSYHDDGFVVLDDVFEPELIDGLLSDTEWMFEPGRHFDVPPRFEAPIHQDPGRKQDA